MNIVFHRLQLQVSSFFSKCLENTLGQHLLQQRHCSAIEHCLASCTKSQNGHNALLVKIIKWLHPEMTFLFYQNFFTIRKVKNLTKSVSNTLKGFLINGQAFDDQYHNRYHVTEEATYRLDYNVLILYKDVVLCHRILISEQSRQKIKHYQRRVDHEHSHLEAL